MRFKSKDIKELVGLAPSTLRDWRRQQKDFEGVWGEDHSKDHTYSDRGLLSLAVMKTVRDGGGTLDEAWSVAFWSIDEIAKHLEVWTMEAWASGNHHKVGEAVKMNYYLDPRHETPWLTSDGGRIGDCFGQIDDGCMTKVFSLRQIAMKIPQAVVMAIGGRRNSHWM